MGKSYNSDDIKVLKEIEHIQLNSGMYIGDTSTPTHLIEEALDNALDEALAGNVSIIAIIINTKDNKISVLDNGRGIPLENNIPVTVSTKLFSGAKFQGKKTAYEISSGLHGIGLVAVNALSSYYKVEVYRNNKHGIFEFKEAKLKYSTIKDYIGEIPFSTKIEFVPDKKYFENLIPNLERIRNRLTTASAEMNNDIQFVLKIDDTQEVFQISLIDHFEMSCLTEKDSGIMIHTLTSSIKPEKFDVMFSYETSGSVSPKIMSSVNLLPVSQGGNHVVSFYDLLKDFFITKAKKYGYKFQPNDCLYRLRLYLILSLIDPKFSGQTKDSLINPKSYFDSFIKEFRTQLEQFATHQEPVLKEYLETFHNYRSKLDSKKFISEESNGRRASTKFTKLRDCTSRNGELYIVEGDSAAGSILMTRNNKIHAILPLKGKSIPNVTTKKNILGSTEVKELITAMGTGITPHCDISKLRYDKIICATDADHDGNHIACLVTMAIAILTPEVIQAGKYYIAQTPLFAINEGKIFIPLWTEIELEEARKANRKITRFKGLGELDPHQLKICLLDEKTRHLISISYSENIDRLINLFSSASEKRTLLE